MLPDSATRLHHQVDPAYRETRDAAEVVLTALLGRYPRADAVHRALCPDPEVGALWEMANYMTLGRLGYNDHGPVHHHIVGSTAVQLLATLVAAGETPDVVASGVGEIEDAFAVVLAAGLLHDIGNGIHRDVQAESSVLLAAPILARTLEAIYPDPRQRALLSTFILGAIASHDVRVRPLTLEAAVVTVADATDLTAGRGRVTYDNGRVDIHSVSALHIESVRVGPGSDRPVAIEIEMTSEAGLFQVEETLVRKVLATPLADRISVRACIQSPPDVTRPTSFDCLTLGRTGLRRAER